MDAWFLSPPNDRDHPIPKWPILLDRSISSIALYRASLYIGHRCISAPPTACLAHVYGRSGTLFDRLDGSFSAGGALVMITNVIITYML